MKLLRISITLIVLLLSCVLTNSQEVVFTPSQYYFSLQENTSSTLGPVYITSNTDITPSYSSSSSNFQVASSGSITLQAGVSLDYEDPDQRRLTTVVSENTTTNTANVTFCLTDVNDNSPTSPTPTALSISITTSDLPIDRVIVRFDSSDADSNKNGLVIFTTDSADFSLTTGGVLVNTAALAPGDYTADIMAVDGGSPSLTSTSVFDLTIVADISLSLQQNRYAFTVNENATNNTMIGTISPVGAVVALNPTDPSIAFDSSNDQISVRPGLDYETRNELTFDLVNASATDTLLGTLVIYVINAEDIPPTLAQTTYDIDLPIDTPANYAVWCIPPLSGGEEDAEVTYSLTGANNLFAVDTDGIITITSSIIDLSSGTVLTMNLTLTDRTQSSDVTLNFNLIASNPPLPGVPQSLNANNDNFTWTASAGIYPTEVFPAGLLYQVTYRTLQNLSDIQTQTTNETILQTTLSQNDVYIYTVAASILNSNFGQTAVTTFATGTENTTATTVNSTAITVSFRQLQYCGADVTVQYDVAYAGVELDTATRNVVTTITNQTASGRSCEPQSVTLTGLEEYVNYMIPLSVTITELGVNNLLIDVVTDETFEAAPVDAPVNVNATSTTATSITVCFEFPDGITQNGQITSFNVTLVGIPFDTESRNVSIAITSTEYPLNGSVCGDVTGLEEYNNYTITVVLINSIGPSPSSSDVQVQTLEGLSTEPLNLASENITSTSFCVTFDPPTNITQNGPIASYSVTYAGNLFNTTQYTSTVSVSSVVYPLTESSSVCIDNLEEYDNYTVSIRAVNGADAGTAANITVETSEAAPLVAPVNLNATSTTANSTIVCFEFPEGITQNGQITSFNVTLVGIPFDTESQTVSIAITSTEYPLTGSVCGDVTGLQEYNNYTITVVLINSIGPSPSSSDVQVRTLEALSTEPLSLARRNLTSTSFCVTFSPPTGITQNGPITNYIVTYVGELFNTTEVSTTVSVSSVVYPLTESSSVCISNLEEYDNYTVLIRAVNGAGAGTAATIIVETSEAAPAAAVQNVIGVASTSVSINICFDPPTNSDQNGIITSFNVTYFGSPFQTDSVTVTVPVVPTDYPLNRTVCRNLTSLQQNNDYNITVIAINSVGPGPISQSIVVTTNESAPGIGPANVTLQTIDSQTIQVTICPPAQMQQNGLITSYNVSYTGDPFDTTTRFKEFSATLLFPAAMCSVFNLTGLQEYNNYTINARAVNSAGSSDLSTEQTAQTNEAVSDAPLNLDSENINSTYLCVTFDPPTNITQNGQISSYIVTYVGELFDVTEANETVSVSSVVYPLTESSSVCISELEEYDNYTVSIRAVNGAGEGTAATIIVETLEAAPDGIPVNLTATSTTPISITVCFEFPEGSTQNGQISSFNVTLVGTPFDTESQTISIAVTSTEYPLNGSVCGNVTDLQEFNNYTITVVLINSIGPSPSSSNVQVQTLETLSSEPLNLDSENINSTYFCVTFDPPTNITQNGQISSYIVTYVGELFDVTEANETVSVSSVVYPLTESSSVCISDLEEYNNYTVSIRAVNGAGEGTAATITVETSEAAPDGVPVNLTATNITPTSIIVCFEFPEGSTQNGQISSFNVTLVGTPFDTESQTISIAVTSTEYPLNGSVCGDVTGLEEYNNYTITVVLINSIGPSPSSSNVQVQTLETLSSEPLNLDSENINSTYFCVTFDPPTNITQNGQISSYIVTYVGELFDVTEANETVSVSSVVYPLTESSSVCISDLEEYNNYTVLIRAVNGAGIGTAANITVETSEAAPTAAVQNVSGMDIRSVSINVCFDPPANSDQNGILTSFNVTYFGSPFQTNSVTVTVPVVPTDYPLDRTVCRNLTSLQQNNDYNIIVIAINSVGPGPISQSIVVNTSESAPGDSPANVTLQTIDSQTIQVTICPPAQMQQNGLITSYNVSYTGDPFDTTTRSKEFSATLSFPAAMCSVFNLTGLQEYNNYTINARAVNSAGSSDLSTEQTAQTNEAVSDAPLNLDSENINSTYFCVTFDPPTNITQNGQISSYIVTYVGELFDVTEANETVSVSSVVYPLTESSSVCISDLEEYDNYTVSIRAVNGAGEGTAATIIVETSEAVSTEPLNLDSENITSTSFCVTFYPPTNITQNGQISSYIVTYVGELFDVTEANETVSVSSVVYPLTESSSVCISDLEEYNNYTVSIRAVNGAGEGTAATITVETSEAAPTAAVQNVSGMDITSVSINVCFDPPTDSDQNGVITSFNVTYFGSPFQAVSVTVTVPVVPTDYPLNRTVCRNLTSLQQNNDYNITVIAINSVGPGPISQSIIVNTSESAPGDSPANVTLQTIDSQTIQVTICPPAQMQQNGLITSYNVSYTGDPFDTTTRFKEFSATLLFPAAMCSVFNLTGLQEYNNYTINARAVNSAGSSDLSTEQTAQTNEAVSDAPLNLDSENINSTYLCVTFDPPTNITQNGQISSYIVTYVGELFDVTEANETVSVSSVVYPLTESSSVCISDLEEYDNYTVLIRAVNGAGEGTAANIIVETLEAAPDGIPVNLTATNITPTSIIVCFEFPEGSTQNGQISSFNVTLVGTPFDTESQTVSIAVTSTEYPLNGSVCGNVTDLQEFNNYTITVVLINSIGPSPSSSDVQVRTLEAVPAQPTNLTSENITSTSFCVTFYPPIDFAQNGQISSYIVTYVGELFDVTEANETVSVSSVVYPLTESSSVCISDLEEYNNYTVSIRAVNGAGEGTAATIIVETSEAVSTEPLNLNSENITSTSFCVTFYPPTNITQNGQISSYTVTYVGYLFDVTEANETVSVSSVVYPLTESSSVCISDLEEYNNYTVLIRAVNGAGAGTAATITVETSEAVPDQPPQNVTTETLNSTAIRVCFYPPLPVNQNGPIRSFNIFYTGDLFQTQTKTMGVPVSPVVYPLNTMFCDNITNLEEFNNYNITVEAVNSIGNGTLSDGVMQLTDEAAPSAPPQNFTTTSGRNISLTYMPPPPIDQNGVLTNYTIEYFGFERDRSVRRRIVLASLLSLNITGLEEDTTYSFKIRASTSVGFGPFTDPMNATTQAAPPSSPPVNITITVINATAFNSTWRIPDEDEHNGALLSVDIRLVGIDVETSITINVPIRTNETSFQTTILTPLEEYVNYSVRFAVENGLDFSPLSDPIFRRTDPTAPSNPPQNVETEAVSPTSISVTFYPPPEIDQNGPITLYIISYTGEIFDTDTQFETINITNPIYPAVGQVSFDLTGLQEYNNYTIKVRAVNSEGMSLFTAGVIQITNEAAPRNTSQNVATVAVNSTSIRVTFNPPPRIDQNGPITSYNISYTGEIFDKVTQFVNLPITNPIYPADAQISFDLTGLQEYNNYTVRVSAINGIGSSEFTAGVIEITNEAAPSDTPQNVTTEALSPTSIRVTFNPPPGIDQNGPITSYNISYTGEIFDRVTQFVNLPITPLIYPADAQVNFDLTGLQEYNNYTISVSSINRIGSSEFTAGVIQITDEAAPSNISQNVATEALGPTSIRVTFNPPPRIDQNGPITSYNISYTGETFDKVTQFVNVPITNPIYPAVAQVSFDLTGLQEYNNYNISVSAINGIGSSEFTAAVIEITDEAVPADSPTLILQSVSTTEISTMISPPSAIDQNGPIISYEVRIYTSLFDIPINLTNVTFIPSTCPLRVAIPFIATGLEEFVFYNLTVRAYTSVGPGEFSSGILNQTDPTVPSNTSQNVTTKPVNSTSIRVTFNPPPGIDQNGPITSYNISYTGEIFDKVTQFVTVPITNPIYPADAQVSFDLTELQEYNNYTISVSAINIIGSSEFTAGVIEITDEAAPSNTSQNVTTEALSPTSIRVTFNPPPGIDQNGNITSYNISYTGEIFDRVTQFVNLPITPLIYPADAQVSFDLTELQEYNNYTIRVSAINGIGSSEFTAGVIEITNEAAPNDTPQNVATVALGPTSIRVTFNPPLEIDQNGPITSYRISYTGETFDKDTQFVTVPITNPIYPADAQVSFDLTGLQEYNNYNISVSAVNGIGSSDFTAGVIQITNEGVSGAPTIIDATSSNPRQVCVVFTPALPIDRNGDITSYFVNLPSPQISGPNNRQCLVNNTSCFNEIGNNIRICFDNLDEGTTYTVSVRAINGASLGDASGVIEVMTMGVSTPTSPPFTADEVNQTTTSTSISLVIPFVSTEFLNSDPNAYNVEFQGFLFLDSLFPSSRRRRQPSSDIVSMTEVMTMVVSYSDNREISLTELQPNYRYNCSVAIRTAFGQTPSVLIVPPTLATAAPTGSPINVTAFPVTAPDGTSQMSLIVTFATDFFTVNGPPDNFTIFYKTGEVEQQMVYNPPNGDQGPYEITISNLPPNRLYTVTVNVATPNGTSEISARDSATTYPLTPTVPSLIPTTAPTTPPATYTVDIVVPTQNAFITANIAVVYIITDYGEDDFSGFVGTRKFSVISMDLNNGFIDGLDGNPRIRIQAALNSMYFDQSGNTFTFLIGNHEETTYNGITYVNYPLEPESKVQYTYYILFFNEEGVTSASFAITGIPDQISTPALPNNTIVIVIILLLIIVILAVVIVILVILVIWYMRRRRSTGVPGKRRKSVLDSLKRTYSNNKDAPKEKSQENLNSGHVLPPPVIMKSTITISNFAKYVEGMAANDRLRFHEEYMSIKDPPHTHDMCSMSSNGPRNRYRDIRTYDHSRVALTIIDGDEYSDYINANFIHGYYKKNEYIAAQGPLDNTIADFWRVVWDWNVPTVVMLTKCVERGRRKCSQYWPDKGSAAYSFYDSTGSSREFVEVTIERETVYAHYIIREIMFTRVDHPNQMKRVIQWHYTSWPDMGVPENGTSLLKFVQKVHQAHLSDSGPMIVHCSAGVGRTGTFITLGCMMPMIREQSLVDVYNFVNRMRDSRNRMVQVEAQYVFIHEALLEFIQHGDTEVAGEDLDTYFRSLDTEEENGTSKLLGQFKRLAYPVRPTEYSVAQSAQNKAKNRYVNILPYNNKRVKLTPVPGVENSDYINASYIDGYWIKNAFIATQGPLQGTIEDFWKMIWEQHVNTIVMLTSEVEAGRERCAHYWPDEQPEYYGQIMVELVDTRMDEGNEFIVHELKVTQTKENRVRKLNHFQYTGWHEREMPDSPTGLNNMIGEIDKFVRGTNPTHPIVIHCSAGVGRTGVFVGAFNMMESLRHDNTVDVFNTVRMMRYQRPAMVQTATQYRFCYIALMDFVSNSEADSVYQNVPKM